MQKDNMRGYEAEELLPLVAKLTRKYTSGESSSVPYETARMLMEAVLYCIREGEEGERLSLMPEGGGYVPASSLYWQGYERVIEKTKKAREMYDLLIKDFEDYGCRNYYNTVIKGLPQFFLRYDARFCPQDHLLTLDYPSMERDDGLCGIDKIHQYISGLCIEKRFLGIFERGAVAGLLQRTMTDYELIYFDNICYQVLLLSLGCMIAGEPVARLKVSGEGLNAVREFFDSTDSESAENKISALIVMLTGRLGDEEMKEYFLKTSHEYAVRIVNAAGVNGLSGVFP